jgi:acyl-CoA hydrolase
MYSILQFTKVISMRFLSRGLVMPNDSNYAGALVAGRDLVWIEKEAAIYGSNLCFYLIR